MRPDGRLIALLAVWTLTGLLPVGWPESLPAWLAGSAVLLGVAVRDGWSLRRPVPLQVERQVSPVLPVGVWSTVGLRLRSRHACRVTVFDHYPQPGECADLPQTLWLAAEGWAELRYRIRPLERGEWTFGAVQTEVASCYGLWRRTLWLGSPLPVKVYPDFAIIARYTLLVQDNRVTALGIHKRRRRGEGQDFHQLREYRVGDSLRRIDWKATARTRKLIAREYREERDQAVVFLLDCSRRMRTRDAELSHFDHALNALILLAYVALRQGDGVGVQSFGGDSRWLAPRKGSGVLTGLIGAVYDLQPTLQAADFSQAAGLLMTRQRKRALVVVLTNLREEDGAELGPAIRLLGQRHLVLIASLRERILDDILQQPPADFRQARLYAATCHYLAARERCQEALRRQGATVLDVGPQDLPVAMVNRYWEIKRSGRL